MRLLAAILLLLAGPALANDNCAPRPVVVEQLADKYGESQQSAGISSSNTMIEVFANEDTGSWTITVTLPAGLTCVVAVGQSFERISGVPLPEGDPT